MCPCNILLFLLTLTTLFNIIPQEFRGFMCFLSLYISLLQTQIHGLNTIITFSASCSTEGADFSVNRTLLI